jgi:filamentous hemagglutinin family protein
MSDRVRSHRFGPPLLAALLAAAPVQAQVVTDGTVGPKVSLQGGEIEIGSDLGTRRGDNLFHSFEKFGIATGQTATFSGPGEIKNVISRVTGGEVSNIDGKLASTVGQADFYFFNPAGVMFGPNAQLDVPGSFHVSTAHELRFADGTRFSALDKTGSGLTVAPPESFGFLDKSPGRITVNQSQLQIKPGKAFSLVGGDIDIAGGSSPTISARSGTVTLTSIAGAGQSWISDGAVNAARQGAIRLSNNARIETSGEGSGTVRIRGGTLTLEQSTVVANNTGERNSSGGIDLQSASLTIDNSRVSSEAQGSGRGGNVTVQAGAILVRNGAAIQTRTVGTGDGGAVAISARSIHLSNGGEVSTESTGLDLDAGIGGPITIIATDTLQLDHSVIRAETKTAKSYDVSLEVGRLFNLYNSKVTTYIARGFGSGGNILVYATRNISGFATSTPFGYTTSTRFVVVNSSDITANTRMGAGGSLYIDADQIMMTPDSVLATSSGLVVSGTFNSALNELSVLPETLLNASSQLREACAARGGRPASSFNASGRGGLPPDPGIPLTASSFGQPLEQQTATGSSTPLAARPPPAAKPITVSGIPQPVLGFPRLACQG